MEGPNNHQHQHQHPREGEANRNGNDDNNDNNDDYAIMTKSDLERWEAFVTSTDWSGTIMKETWYGHHNPCRRLALFIHLSSFLSTIVLAWNAFQNWPILQYSTTKSSSFHHHNKQQHSNLQTIQQSHWNCLEEICNVLYNVEFDCEMTKNGNIKMKRSETSIYDYSDYYGEHSIIPFPDVCMDAIQQTFGDSFLLGNGLLLQPKKQTSSASSSSSSASSSSSQKQHQKLDLIHFKDPYSHKTSSSSSKQDGDDDNNNNIINDPFHNRVAIINVLPDQCLLQESILELLLLGQHMDANPFLIDLVNDSFRMVPGDKQTIYLRNYACPQYMPWYTPKLAKQYQRLYNFAMEWRRSTVICLLYWINMAFYSAICATRVLTLIIPGILLWIFLLPKHHEIRGRYITIFSTISTLILLQTLTDEEGTGRIDEAIRTGILIASALSVGNQAAALEWFFLFFLSYVDLSNISIFGDDDNDDGGNNNDGSYSYYWNYYFDSSKINYTDMDNDPIIQFLFGNINDNHQQQQSSSSFGIITTLWKWFDVFWFYILPGYGLWKLVFIYIVYMSFPRISTTTTTTTTTDNSHRDHQNHHNSNDDDPDHDDHNDQNDDDDHEKKD